MNFIKTPSFEVAVYAQGDPASDRLALVLPGRLDTKDYPHMRGHVDFLSARGLYALSFDPPGTWASPGGIELYTMTNYLQAINELIEHFDNRPTILIGHSRGGSMAMLAGMRNDQVMQIVAIMSNTAPNKIGEGIIKNGIEITYRDMPDNPEQKKRFDLPLNFFKDAAQYDLLDDLKRCAKPKLFILGKRDTTVDPQNVRTAFKFAAEPKKLYELDSEHDYRRHHRLIDEVNNIVGKFIEEYRA